MSCSRVTLKPTFQMNPVASRNSLAMQLNVFSSPARLRNPPVCYYTAASKSMDHPKHSQGLPTAGVPGNWLRGSITVTVARRLAALPPGI